MRKLILIPSMVLLLGLITAVPVFAGFPPDYDLDEGADCFGKMASGQAQDHQGWQNVADEHGKDTTIEGINGSRTFCENL